MFIVMLIRIADYILRITRYSTSKESGAHGHSEESEEQHKCVIKVF